MCGNNSQLLKTAKTLKSVSKTIGGPEIAGIPYTTEVQKYLRASDIVVGKAGPNTIFESVATLTPFFAISHVSGQENGNLEIIKKYKIGYVEEKPVLATLRLKEIIENPKILSKFQNNLKALSAYNQNSERKLLKLLRP
jgi:processive 1,2-diacylglycerol beta-glucosyltransferase